MDSSFSMTEAIYARKTITSFNMHELNIIDEGRTALHISYMPKYLDITNLGLAEEAGWVADLGIREVDIVTGQTKFEWWASDHVSLNESSVALSDLQGPHPNAWNFL